MPDKGPGILRSLERITQSPTRVRSWLRVIGVPPATTLPLQARSWLAALFVAAAAGIAGANEPSSKDMAFFTEQIQPILKDRCYECHSHDSGKTKGGLALDFRS